MHAVGQPEGQRALPKLPLRYNLPSSSPYLCSFISQKLSGSCGRASTSPITSSAAHRFQVLSSSSLLSAAQSRHPEHRAGSELLCRHFTLRSKREWEGSIPGIHLAMLSQQLFLSDPILEKLFHFLPVDLSMKLVQICSVHGRGFCLCRVAKIPP